MPNAGLEPELWIKVKGQEYAYAAINVDRSQEGWIKFDRVNTKTGEIAGGMEVSLSEVVSIEKKHPVE